MALINALITGIVFMLIFKNQALFGASGVLFMMIMMTSFTNKEKNTLPLTLLFVAGLYLGQDMYNMIFKDDNVSQATHLLGGLIGIYAIYYQQKMTLAEDEIITP
jgi:GlpG protein